MPVYKAVSLQPVYQRLRESESFERILAWCREHADIRSGALHVKSALGSLPPFILYHVFEHLDHPLLCVLTNEDAAAYCQSDIEQIAPEGTPVLRLPVSGIDPYDKEQVPDPGPIMQRAEVLQQLTDGKAVLVVTSIQALCELLPPTETVQAETLLIKTGEALGLEVLIERLTEQGFERTEFVEQPGDIAVRGGILDVYPFAGDYPIRIEFFGDEIDSIREFDPKTQRSVSRLSQTRIVPNLEAGDRFAQVPHTPLFDYLPANTMLVGFDPVEIREAVDSLFEKAHERYSKASMDHPGYDFPEPGTRYLDRPTYERAVAGYTRLMFGHAGNELPDEVITFEVRPQPNFNSNVNLLRRRLQENAARHIETYILCDSQGQLGRLRELLEEDAEPPVSHLVVESLHEGFEVPGSGLAVYTDHQIFNRYHRPTARKRKRQMGGMTPRELKSLSPGDFVVHVDYGIGKFAGMERITVRDKVQEAVRILFADNDMLYVNVNALYKLQKYSGREGHQPKLTKLGSGQWERAKTRTKKRLKDMARELINLYARRKQSRGHAFSPDSIWQRELEASFQYEDTPDQATTAEAVKQDMEQPIPMDRLVCGDVGFGKTEIAVRAAFKAAQDGKQVAVLVPTTILADQHFATFKKRLGQYPVRIEVISRFRSAAEQKEIIQKVKKGEVDILIGTHRLVAKDVTFKDLGLLIIDEEQRFGVAAKEKLRQLRAEVDTLTLTATPIPRTLQFSLLGARDLSIISTPPPNRQPIFTEIHSFDKDLIRDAILYEVTRGGQVFFIHNRVQNITEMAAMLRALVPNIRVKVGHGQMTGKELEDVMTGFVDHKFDVLVSTNIIESGLDISNANTIIINHAEMFGLSDLHQMRGRVGRSDRKAFCYLLVPSIHSLTREAKARLQAVEEFSELGSGFNIAMRDMDIRGAGNLLGAEQTGFIDEVGFETYHKILDEAVEELRSEEFQGLFETAPVPKGVETAIEVEEDAFIPNEYISNTVERLNVYRSISEAETGERLLELRDELTDRFGAIPPEVETLLTATELKLSAQALRLAKASFKNQRLFLEFPSQEADPYFYQSMFQPLLEQLGKLKNRYVIKDTNRKLRAIVQDVQTLDQALDILGKLELEFAGVQG